jgi:bifunctional N-acetylglucosamine-1-phosphate-uridyltransferase/glucosamine-1-phosphate-acetyltransferase GlmU-like protein
MDRLLIIPAAGRGSRLGLELPKLLVPVNGRPMIDHLFALYAPIVDRAALVVHPSAVREIQTRVAAAPFPVELFVQHEPTGMLDAILLARPAVELSAPRRVLITWCDQVAIRPETVARLQVAADAPENPHLVMPTAISPDPYVHLVRDARGGITAVLHRREGDEMPPVGEGDAGVFEMSREAYLDWLPLYAAAPQIGARTGERNFVPFVVWVAHRGSVVTLPCGEPGEAVGINTREDLEKVEQMLRARTAGKS